MWWGRSGLTASPTSKLVVNQFIVNRCESFPCMHRRTYQYRSSGHGVIARVIVGWNTVDEHTVAGENDCHSFSEGAHSFDSILGCIASHSLSAWVPLENQWLNQGIESEEFWAGSLLRPCRNQAQTWIIVCSPFSCSLMRHRSLGTVVACFSWRFQEESCDAV